MPLYRIFILLFAALMIFKAISHFLRHKKTLRELVVWVLVWGGTGIVVAYPQVVDLVPGYTGIKSGVNAVIIFALVVLFYVVFKLIIKLEDLEKKLTEIARKLALRDFEKKR